MSTPICSACNDTHLMGEGWACTRCPTPCEDCRSRGPGRFGGPFCAVTPCGCKCHANDHKYAGRSRQTHAIVSPQNVLDTLESEAVSLRAELAKRNARISELEAVLAELRRRATIVGCVSCSGTGHVMQLGVGMVTCSCCGGSKEERRPEVLYRLRSARAWDAPAEPELRIRLGDLRDWLFLRAQHYDGLLSDYARASALERRAIAFETMPNGLLATRASETSGDPEADDELSPLRMRVAEGRAKYPDGCTALSFLDEAGEVAHALNKRESVDRVRDELLDAAGTAMRLYLGEVDTKSTVEGLEQRLPDGTWATRRSERA